MPVSTVGLADIILVPFFRIESVAFNDLLFVSLVISDRCVCGCVDAVTTRTKARGIVAAVLLEGKPIVILYDGMPAIPASGFEVRNSRRRFRVNQSCLVDAGNALTPARFSVCFWNAKDHHPTAWLS